MTLLESTYSALPTPPLSPEESLRWTRIGALSALAMLLGYLESFLPIPIPGVKLGLANIAVLVALARHDLMGAFFVGLVKVAATGLLFGNPVTLAYSATGTLLAFCLMAPLSCLPTMRLWMVSIVGALAHEAGQLLVAQALLGTPLVWYGAPVLAVAGCVTGLLCGLAAEGVARELVGMEDEWDIHEATLRQVPEPSAHDSGAAARQVPALSSRDDRTTVRQVPAPSVHDGETTARQVPAPSAHGCEAITRQVPAHSAHGGGIVEADKERMRSFALLAAFVAIVAAVMHTQSIEMLAALLALSSFACVAAHVPRSALAAALGPTVSFALIAFVAQVVSTQQGTVMASLGPITITQEALVAGAAMMLRLATITTLSISLVHLAGRTGLASCAHMLLKPMQALGIRTAGPELSLSCTLLLISLFTKEMSHSQDFGSIWSMRFWTTELPQLAAKFYRQLITS